MVSLSLFYMYYFGRYSCQWVDLILCSLERYFHFDNFHDFTFIHICCVVIPFNSFVTHTAIPWEPELLPAKCFPLTYDVIVFRLELTSTLHLLTLCNQLSISSFSFCFFLVTSLCFVWSEP